MYLKTLIMQGFKSFAERTVIDFSPGVTAFVGPNGSGKSNVADAIRWVLGEQSAKTLRGQRMEDVIFSGTGTRRPLSYAEVTIVLDNSDGGLDWDYREIEVTRRLYRTGESEYYLNRNRCLLRDITTLFMDTGIGRDGYSIVGQGRIDELLSGNPDERRRIFEEAAGIVRFRKNQQDSEKRLATAAQNMERVGDLLGEMERQRRPLLRQAETAKEFLRLRQILTDNEVALLLVQSDQQAESLAVAETARQIAADELDELSAARTELQREHEANIAASESNEASIDRLRDEVEALRNDEAEVTTETDLARQRVESLKKQAIEAAALIAESDARRVELEREMSDRTERGQVMQRDRERFEERLAAEERELNALTARLDVGERQTEVLRQEFVDCQDSLFECRDRLAEIRTEKRLAEENSRRLEREESELISVGDALSLTLEEQSERTEQLAADLATGERILEEERRKVRERGERIAASETELNATRQEKQRAQFRLTTLRDLEDSFAGYHDAVQAVLKEAKRRDDDRTVVGAIGSLIQVPADYRMAISVALGAAIQNIVVRSERSAREWIDWLRERRAGRATFLPLDTIRPREPDHALLNRLSAATGYIGLASELVTCSDETRPITDWLLNRTLIAADLAAATAMAAQSNYRIRIVTLGGDVVNVGGSLTGGYNIKQESPVLGRAGDLKKLEREITALQKHETQLAAQLTELSRGWSEAERALRGNEEELIRRRQELVAEQDKLAAHERNIAVNRRARDDNLSAREAAVAEQERLREWENAQLATEAEITARVETLQAEIERSVSGNRAAVKERDERREYISDLRLSLNSIVESQNSLTEMTERIAGELAESAARSEQRVTEKAAREKEAELLSLSLTNFGARLKRLAQKREERNSLLNELIARRNEYRQNQEEFITRLQETARREMNLTTERERAEARVEKARLYLAQIRNRMWEEYALTVEQALKEGKARELENTAATEKLIRETRQKIRDMGNVNVNAVETLRELEQRLNFTNEQMADLEASARKLEKVIDELLVTMRDRFSQSLLAISKNYDAVFRELFGGGQAEIFLADPTDVLNSPIEIRVQPPGKRLQNMLLLSGGERSLAAIALLFAILRLTPSPFCVLDEIEAALDEANVWRFNKFLSNYSLQTQFILVTHRSGTMECADYIYGVTMQERGVSRVLSLKLKTDEVDGNGLIE
ncbi:MAG: chromosome segregation protein SMC [Clostridiaceae bacterium]|nr:chromosome segregation protein SMC [Clostridiaceae bacterium]